MTFTFLNLLVFFPCCLMLPTLWPRARRPVRLLAALFALNPLIIQNATYTWTKLLAVFYVVLGLWFYLAGWRKGDQSRMVAAFVALAAGIMVHYSAGPYLVFLALHYLLFVFRRRRRWREAGTALLAGGALLVSWFAWSIAVYGMWSTLASNTAVTAAAKVQGSNWEKIAANLLDTLVPFPLRNDAPVAILHQPSQAGALRDVCFLIYQTNLIFALGVVGGPLVLYLLYRTFRPLKRPEASFWLMLVLSCLVHGERETFGVTHVTLQPLAVLGLALLAAGITSLRRLAVFFMIAGCALDFALGIFLQVHIQNFENIAGVKVFEEQGGTSLTYPAWENWSRKHLLTTCGPAQLPKCLAADQLYFGGWYSRHNGQAVFLGDWFEGQPLFLVLLGFPLWIAALLPATPDKALSGKIK